MGDKKILAFDVFYPVENEFELIRTLITIYLNSEIASGRLATMPSPQMVNLLVFYIKHGYSTEAKKKAASFLKINKTQTIDSLNFKLKTMGFLNETPMSKRDKELNSSLSKLRQYYLENKGDKYVIRSVIAQKNA